MSDSTLLELPRQINVLDHGFVRLDRVSGGDLEIVNTARKSFNKKKEVMDASDRGLIRYLVRNNHTTPIEFVQLYFTVHLPIYVARQFVRHRMASIDEWSGRYIQLPDETHLPELDELCGQSKDNKQGSTLVQIDNAAWVQEWMQGEQRDAFSTYQQYLDEGLSKEMARINLPLSTYTEWCWTMDLHNLMRFLKLRMDSHAQRQIRVYADAIYELAKPFAPEAFAAFEEYWLYSTTLSQSAKKALAMTFFDFESVRRWLGNMHSQGMTKNEARDTALTILQENWSQPLPREDAEYDVPDYLVITEEKVRAYLEELYAETSA